jgi:hypothetical protein
MTTQQDAERIKLLTADLKSADGSIRMGAVESLMRGEDVGLMAFSEIEKIMDHGENARDWRSTAGYLRSLPIDDVPPAFINALKAAVEAFSDSDPGP